ncbi:PEP-CTERM sorting domain-containing protein [Haloferula chungangensis]|uniref:PEP-CTERM sorting domain-containing protein n=1 Tax=Haloferula chungangensis TaxID=1048331 RepID=A0ABW2L7Y2_9BACT
MKQPAKKSPIRLSIVTMGLIALSTSAQAAVTVTETVAEENFGNGSLFDTIDEVAYPAVTYSDISFPQKASGSMAQTMTTGNQGINVSMIELMTRFELDPENRDLNLPLTLHVFEVADALAVGLDVPTTTLLTESFTINDMRDTDHLLRIELNPGTSLALAANTSYAFYLDVSDPALEGQFAFLRTTSGDGDGGSIYAGGAFYENGTIKSDGARDAGLALTGTFIVPEPSGVVLIGLGLLCCGRRRRSS